MDDLALGELTAARDVLLVTSTFGDGGPPDNGADFWGRLAAPDAPQLREIRYAVLGIGDRAYAAFCGHAKSLDRRMAELGAAKLLDPADNEAYEDEPMQRWAEVVTGLLTGSPARTAARTVIRTEPDEFTRAKPILAPLSRNEVLTALGSAKGVRQFGFDISEYDVSYAAGDCLGVYATNDPAVVDAWLIGRPRCRCFCSAPRTSARPAPLRRR